MSRVRDIGAVGIETDGRARSHTLSALGMHVARELPVGIPHSIAHGAREACRSLVPLHRLLGSACSQRQPTEGGEQAIRRDGGIDGTDAAVIRPAVWIVERD